METFKEKSPRTVEAIQIADNVIDIMSLPCVQSVEKQMDVDYPYLYHLTNNVVAKKGDWLVFMGSGYGWKMMPDVLFQKQYACEGG